MSDTYLSIENPAVAEYKEKGSKFLAFAYPVESEAAVKEVLQKLKEEYWDASHHCYAYMLGARHDIFRANDAGEPNHSAGDPILSQIKSLKVTDVLIVVVRYFGGTKLGIPGLISAYKASAREVLSEAKIIEKYIRVGYNLKFGSDQTSLVMKSIKNSGAEIVNQDFDYETLTNIMDINIRKSQEDFFLNQLEGALGIQIARSL